MTVHGLPGPRICAWLPCSTHHMWSMGSALPDSVRRSAGSWVGGLLAADEPTLTRSYTVERTCRHNDNAVGREAARAALDVAELLQAYVSAEACLQPDVCQPSTALVASFTPK